MLLRPNVGKDESSHVGKSRNLRTLMVTVVRPDISHKKTHHVDVFIGFTRHVTCNGKVEMPLDPAFAGGTQHTSLKS